MRQRAKRGGVFVLALVSVSAVTASTVAADDAAPDATPVVGVIGAPLSDLSGPVDVVLRLSEPALAEAVAPNATRNDTLPDGAAQDAIIGSVEDQQHRVLAAASDLGATELGSISRSLNAVMVHADASVLPDLAAIPGVTAVSPLPSYSVAAPTDTAAVSGRLDQARQ